MITDYHSSQEDADLLKDARALQNIDPEFAKILLDTADESARDRAEILGTSAESEQNRTILELMLQQDLRRAYDFHHINLLLREMQT